MGRIFVCLGVSDPCRHIAFIPRPEAPHAQDTFRVDTPREAQAKVWVAFACETVPAMDLTDHESG